MSEELLNEWLAREAENHICIVGGSGYASESVSAYVFKSQPPLVYDLMLKASHILKHSNVTCVNVVPARKIVPGRPLPPRLDSSYWLFLDQSLNLQLWLLDFFDPKLDRLGANCKSDLKAAIAQIHQQFPLLVSTLSDGLVITSFRSKPPRKHLPEVLAPALEFHKKYIDPSTEPDAYLKEVALHGLLIFEFPEFDWGQATNLD